MHEQLAKLGTPCNHTPDLRSGLSMHDKVTTVTTSMHVPCGLTNGRR